MRPYVLPNFANTTTSTANVSSMNVANSTKTEGDNEPFMRLIKIDEHLSCLYNNNNNNDTHTPEEKQLSKYHNLYTR